MKKIFTKKVFTLWFLSLCLFGTITAQTIISGKITDDKNETLPGASVVITGTTNGTATDIDGKYSLEVPKNATSITFSFAGYESLTLPIGTSNIMDVQLKTSQLNEVVVIGYGSIRKKDLTGSVTSIESKDFLKGPIVSPEQLLSGKVAGVQITAATGAPGAGGRIRIRGTSSINGSSDPLIVVDGIPLDITGVGGSSNALNLINPNDIESLTVLKDASATAIYGSRAASGVIIITTKKGTGVGGLQFSFGSTLSLAQKTATIPVLNGDDFRAAVKTYGDAKQVSLLGTANTNWQNEIYRNAFNHDENFSVLGNVSGVPFRASVGYTNQQGLLLNDGYGRTTGSLSLTPRLFDNHLKVEFNGKVSNTKNHFSDQGAIFSAVSFDPTQSVLSGNTKYGGYYEWLDQAGNPNTLAPKNPVGLLNQKVDNSNVNRLIGNVQLDYKLHFFPDLHAVMNLGLDHATGTGTVVTPATSAGSFFAKGSNSNYDQVYDSKLFTFYLNYVKELKDLDSRFDITAGYDYQDYINTSKSFNQSGNGDSSSTYYKGQFTTIGFYGRFNYAFKDKYLLTATVRDDGSSKLNPNGRWVVFPSIALAWKMGEEDFIKNSNVFSDMKLRVGYGSAGNQAGIDFYSYLPRYTLSDPTATYIFDTTRYRTFRPEGYNSNLTWEKTSTYNVALDFALKNNRISGTVEYYLKQTSNLLTVVPVPAGSNLINQIISNVGNMENQGVEFTLNTKPVITKDFYWDLGFNITYNKNKITKLTIVEDPKFIGFQTGGIYGGVGNNIQINSVGYPVNSFFTYQQQYDEKGVPIEAKYADQNGDGKITIDDRVRYKSPDPTVFYGINSSMTYKAFSLSFSMHGNAGNYVYNNVKSELGTLRVIANELGYLANVHPDAVRTGFKTNQYFSDYYIEDGSFVRMDNITLGYQLKPIDKLKLRFTAMVQNVFVITKYSGLDPEIAGGIDSNIYPRPRIFSLGVNATF